MKKILLASTALVLSAGIAAAEVRVTGDGRMGVDRAAAVGGPTTNLSGRVRINFGLSASGDHGLTFGGTLRVGQYFAGGTSTSLISNGSVFIQAGGLRVTYGDIDGAVANTVAIYGGGLGYTGRVGRPNTHGAFNTAYLEGDTGATSTVRADYSMSGFTVSVAGRQGVANDAEIAVAYSASGFGVAVGYEEGGQWSVSATYAAGAFGVGALVTDVGANTNARIWGSYDMGAVRVAAIVGRVAGNTSAGLGVRYGLGGGANFHAAVGSEVAGGVRQTTAQVGVTFAF